MKTLRWFMGIGVLAVCASGAAMAADVGGVKLDDKATVGGKELVFNGAGIRTKAIFKVYVASLYLPQKASNLQGVLAQSPRRIQLNLLRNVSAEQMADALNDGLVEANTAADLAAVKPQADQLRVIMSSIKQIQEKDVVTLDFVDGATKVSSNGEAKGTIPGAAFNQALTKIWIGDKAIQADLKKALLGG